MKSKLTKILAVFMLIVLFTSFKMTASGFDWSALFNTKEDSQTPEELQKQTTVKAIQEGNVTVGDYIVEAKYNHKGKTYLLEGEPAWEVADVKSVEESRETLPSGRVKIKYKSEEITPKVKFGNSGDVKGTTIKNLMDFLNDTNIDAGPSMSTGLRALRSFPSFFCLKGGQAIGRYHGYFQMDHHSRSQDLSIPSIIQTNNSSYGAYSITYFNPDAFNSSDHLDMVIEPDHARQTCADGKTRYGTSTVQNGLTFGLSTDFTGERASAGETTGELGIGIGISDIVVGGNVGTGGKPSSGGKPATTENKNSRYVYSNVHYWEEYTNIYTINNKFGTYHSNIFPYAVSFSEKMTGNYTDINSNRYNQERAQNAIWGVVGDPARGEGGGNVDTDVSVEDVTQGDTSSEAAEDVEYSEVDANRVMNSKLWEAGAALNEYEALLTVNISGDEAAKHAAAIEGKDENLLNRPSVKINADPGSDDFTEEVKGEKVGSKDDSTGTTIYEENGEYYYKVGPFIMSDYALAFAVDERNIENFSGSYLGEKKSMIGGILEGKVTFENEAGAPIEVDIGKLVDDQVEIVYTDMKGRETGNKGHAISATYIRTPSETEYEFPYPNSTFYITIKRSVIESAVKLTKFEFNYRQTKSDGRGWVICSKYVVTKWTRDADANGTQCWENYHITKTDKQLEGGSDKWGEPESRTKYDKIGDWQETTYYAYCPNSGRYPNDYIGYGDNERSTPGWHECLGDHSCSPGSARSSSGLHWTDEANHYHSCDNWDWDYGYCTHRCGLGCKDGCTHTCGSSCIRYYCLGGHECPSGGTRSGCNCSCDGHYRTGWAYYRCPHTGTTKVHAYSGEGHTECWYIPKWQNPYKGVAKGQTFLAVRDAYTAVIKTPITTELDIRLTTDVTVNKFITDVEHEEIEGNTLDLDTSFQKSEIRAKLSDNAVENERLKEENPVFVEYGDIVTYIIRLENHQLQKVEAKIIDFLPENCELISISDGTEEWTAESPSERYIYTKEGTKTTTQEGVMGEKVSYTTHKFKMETQWLQIPGGTQDAPGKVDLTVKVKVLDWVDGLDAGGLTSGVVQGDTVGGGEDINPDDPFGPPTTPPTPPTPNPRPTPSTPTGQLLKFENKAQIITNNIGYVQGDELNVDYMRTVYDSEDRPGPVVNLAELDPNKLTESSDWYALNNYNLGINKFISDYKSPVSEANEERGITKDEKIEVDDDTKSRSQMSEADKEARPFPAEKNDILTYKIRLTNDAQDEYTEKSSYGGKKPATQVRPNNVIDEMHEGLRLADQGELSAVGISGIPVSAKIYDSSGNVKVDNVNVTYTNVGGGNGRTRYEFTIENFSNGKYVLLDPGDYLEYTVYVKVIESNMYLGKLDNEASYKILTNVNAKTLDRIIQNEDGSVNENMAPQQKTKEWVKMKDLVIAGTVWLDVDKDGHIGPGKNGILGNMLDVRQEPSTKLPDYNVEYAMKNIVVKLYKEDGTLVRTTATNDEGLYTFAQTYDENSGTLTWCDGEYTHITAAKDSDQRIDKAEPKDPTNKTYGSGAKLVNYYIEFEYDGLVYKSTEIYSNDKNINGDGTYNDPYEIDSNAYEFKDVREEFNTNYEIIAYNKGYKGDGTTPEHPDLKYEKKDHESYIRVNKDRVITARSFIKGKDLTKSIENTKLLWLYKQQSTELPETEYLKFINLGLEEREDVDLSITHDVYELKTTINGEEMTYEFNQNKYTRKDPENTAANEIDKEKAPGTEKFDSERFMTGYRGDGNGQTPTYYNFEYYLEDYNYRISQYNIQTVRNYKGSPLRTNYDAIVNDGGNSVILDNTLGTDSVTNALVTGRESELNTEIKYRIRVTNNVIDNDEPYLPSFENGASVDIPVYTGVNEIVEYYSEDFVDIQAGANGEIQAFNVKTKDANDYLVNTAMKVAEAKAYLPDGTEVDVTLSNTSPYNTTRTIEGYDTIFITPTNQNFATNALTGTNIKAGQLILAEGESLDIIIKFVVEKEAETPNKVEMETILGAKENVAEVSAYSTYYKEGETYKSASLVDADSNPGNFGEAYEGVDVNNAGYIKFYEDDTFKTGINLTIPTPTIIPDPDPDDPDPDPDPPTPVNRDKEFIERTLIGYVWDDARSETAENDDGTQYLGDGKWNTSVNAIAEARKNRAKLADGSLAVPNGEENDIRVQDVEAKLVEQIRIPVNNAGEVISDKGPEGNAEGIAEERIYEDTIYVNEDSVMETRTDANGEYMLSGYIPGEYIVKFTYGDDVTKEKCLIFNGQDYKSTSYQAGEAVLAENAQPQGEKTAGDVRLDILEKDGISDAKDDEMRRLEVIGYSETMNNQKNEILRGINSTDRNAMIGNTAMFAETADFLVRTEKEIRKVTVLTYQEYNTKIIETISQARFRVNNVDFGIEYRPELQLGINKYISNITLTTSDQNGGKSDAPLVDAVFDEFYGVVKETDYVTGATTFCTDSEGEIIRVDPAASTEIINSVLSSAGVNTSSVEKNNDGTYILAVAGTELNKDKSIGLSNVQYLPNEYETDAEGNPVTVEANGKVLVSSTQGFAYIVVDDDIMQGATIKIKYLFTGTNLGEIDRVSSNLSDLRFKENNEVRKYDRTINDSSSYYNEYDYQISGQRDKLTLINQNYSAAKTARNALFSEYYRYELNGNDKVKYLNGATSDLMYDNLKGEAENDILYKVKQKYTKANDRVVEIVDVENAHTDTTMLTPVNSALTGSTYYGRYLGSTYFTGRINEDMDVLAELKVDKVLDYIDNDLVFNNDDNRGEDRLWKTTTAAELFSDGMLNETTYSYYQDGELISDNAQIQANKEALDKKLVDSDGRAYNTEQRSNLAISLDDRVRDDYGQPGAPALEEDTTTNKKFTNFLIPRYSREKSLDSFGTISLYASKVISPEDENDDMVYENIAEIIQYSSVTGRVTNLATTIGNAKIEELTNSTPDKRPNESSEYYEGRTESDTASVEKVTLTPPTGLDRLNRTVRKVVEGASYTVVTIIAVILVCVVVLVIIKIYRNRRIK